MTNLTNLTTNQFRRMLALKEQIQALQSQFDAISKGGDKTFVPSARAPGTKRRMSAAGRAAIKEAQRVRWAKVRGNGASAKQAKAKKGRRHSPATRARLAAAARARWTKAKAAGKRTL